MQTYTTLSENPKLLYSRELFIAGRRSNVIIRGNCYSIYFIHNNLLTFFTIATVMFIMEVVMQLLMQLVFFFKF
jgi:hypothetical protein